MTDQTDRPTLTPNPDGGVILHLPDTTHIDTQVWSVDVGLTDAGLKALRAALASSVGQAPATDQTALRDRIAEALYPTYGQEDRNRSLAIADAVLAVLPATTYQAAQIANLRTMYDVANARTNDLIEERDQLLEARTDRAATLDRIRKVVRRLAAHATGFQDVLDESDRGPWGKTIAADIAELRRMADETQPAEVEAEACAHCGKSILRIVGTLAAWWVHDPGGHTICDPQQAASSPRATPKPAAEAQDGVQR